MRVFEKNGHRVWVRDEDKAEIFALSFDGYKEIADGDASGAVPVGAEQAKPQRSEAPSTPEGPPTLAPPIGA